MFEYSSEERLTEEVRDEMFQNLVYLKFKYAPLIEPVFTYIRIAHSLKDPEENFFLLYKWKFTIRDQNFITLRTNKQPCKELGKKKKLVKLLLCQLIGSSNFFFFFYKKFFLLTIYVVL